MEDWELKYLEIIEEQVWQLQRYNQKKLKVITNNIQTLKERKCVSEENKEK